MLMSHTELQEFYNSFTKVINMLGKFGKRLTPRDVIILQIGLQASHIEEAIASGDSKRAQVHLKY